MDEFKTQVLLLHSEQSTLDNLRSGFSDNYTVHCATSGSEALNTLVDTPINVIVTAQELPGMSGLEALREAKKRSPDTVGILLAGNANSGLEALVGDKEVFQVVRGNVSSDAVLKLVEQATQQIRLMALAQSANDTAANPDEPVSQHIVMETSDNGSPIVSDGTGQLPTLNPQKVSAAASVGSRAVDVLVLTKDDEFLQTIKDSSRGMHKVFYTNTLAQADEAIRKHKIGVAVVDSAMVGEKIEKLTLHLRKNSPRLVSIVAGRRDDGEMLMDLINRGKVYRFLLKPVSPGRARLAVEASVKHHLEAPDAAFMPKSGATSAAPALTSVSSAKSSPVAKIKATPKPVPRPAPIETVEPTPAPSPPDVPADPPLESTGNSGQYSTGVSESESSSDLETSLTDAFGDDDSRFVNTVSGFLGSDEKTRSGHDGLATDEELSTPDSISSSPFDSSSDAAFSMTPKLMGIGAGVIAVVAAGLFWVLGDSGDSVGTSIENPVTAEASGSTADSVTESAPQVRIDAGVLREDARTARAAGQIFSPIENNAIDLFAAALAAAPSDSTIAVELDAVLDQALGMAETAMLENRLNEASDALQRVEAVAENNTRLPFLTAQLQQMQLRSHLDQARTALRDSRFEDAASAITAARSLGVSDATDIDLAQSELAEALSVQKVDDVLAKANDRLVSGDLLTPANNNARYYFGRVLASDAGNTTAQQGLNIIASKLALQARSEIDKGNFSAAEKLLSNARDTDRSNAEIAVSTKILADTRAANAAQKRRAAAAAREAEVERQAEAQRQAEINRVAEEERLRLAALAPETTDVDAAVETQLVTDTPTKFAAATPAGPEAENTAIESGKTSTGLDRQALVPVSSLTRKRYVAPRYPRSAQRRGLSGWVDVVFTVGFDGTTKNVVASKSEPGETFVDSAVKAVEKWEFEPVVEDGVLTEKRAGVRMMFAFEN